MLASCSESARRASSSLVCVRFIESARNVVILGPVGVGKTFLATALGHIACRRRFQAMLTRADDMLRRLKAESSRQLTRCADD